MKRMALVLAIGLSTCAIGVSPVAGFGQAVQKPTGDVSGMNGWIEDGIAHKPGTAHADVVKSVAGGAPLVFVDDKSKQVYKIDNPEMVKGHEGHHVAFSGGIDSVNKTVHVESISMLKNQSPGPAAEAVGH